jgi:tetratricopeptide (TPR) repeat protein
VDNFSYLSALRIADKIQNPGLQRQSLLKLSEFYAGIEDYDKAIDYRVEAGTKLREIKLKSRIGYYQVEDIKAIGDLYAAKKSYPLAIENYQESIDMADSLNYSPLKVPGYIGLLNVYLMMKEPQKSMEFISSPNGTKLKEYFTQLNMAPVIDQAYGIIYSEMGILDSAGKYFERSAPFFESYSNPAAKMSSYVQTAYYLKQKGDNQQAIDLLLKARTLANTNGQLEAGMEISKNLDTLYDRMGDFRQSKIYSAEYFQMKDSLQNINKEKELSQVEADDELQQLKKQELAAAETKRQRNNIQYLAITIGIATTFLLLVLLGMFRVSARTIKVIGFFAFLLFFEFIFLVFKKNIYAFSHGEPWIDLSFMIALAAILVPLHHWMEHKVLHYLTANNKLTSVGESLKERFRGKDKAESIM